MIERAPARLARSCAVLWVALVATTSSRAASAQSPADLESARTFFIEGTRRGNEGRWREARELYARSLQLKAAPITRYSLGVAQRQTGRLADALSSFRAFLAAPPEAATAPYREPARAAVVTLERSIGRVTIRVEPHSIDGLSLAIDGEPVPPALDRPREIDAGAHEIVAHAPGFLSGKARFGVAAGAEASVVLTLTRGASVVRPHATPGPAPRAALPPGSPVRPLPIVLLGLGGAFFGAGLTVGLVGVSQASHAPTRDGAEGSAARAKGIAGDVMGTVGIATAGVGLVLLLVEGRAAPPRTGAVSASAKVYGLGLRF
jgi:hypothetical protein